MSIHDTGCLAHSSHSYIDTFETVFYSAYSSLDDDGLRSMMTSEQLLELCQGNNFNNTLGQLAVSPVEMVLTISKMLSVPNSPYYSNRGIDRPKVVESYKLLKGREGMQSNILPVADLFAQLPKARSALNVVFTTFFSGLEPPPGFLAPSELQLTKEFYNLPTMFRRESNLADLDLADGIADRFKNFPIASTKEFL